MGEAAPHLDLPAGKDAITPMADWAEARAAALGLDAGTVFAVRLCVEEAVTNIVRYAYDGEPGDHHVIGLDADLRDGSACFSVVDGGRPFDPVSAEEPGREGTILDATVGGRGIRLMRQFTKAMRYERRDGRNRLTLVF